MVILLTLIESQRTCFRYLLHWVCAPAYFRSKRITPINKRNHRHSPQKPDWLKQEIIRLKAHMPLAGCRSIADLCNRRFAASRKITVGKTYVHETLQRHAYEVQILRRNLKQEKPKSVPRNLIWGIDLTGKTDAQGKLYYLLGIIDHGSRALLHLQALHDKTSHTLIARITEVIKQYGKPKIIRTDNEGMFRSLVFGKALKQLGIRHQRTVPGCPWQNGRIERLFGTLKDKLDQWIVAGIEQLNRDLDTFRYWYNHIRPHQNLDGRTPAEARNGIDPYAKSAKQEHWFEAWDGLLSGYCLRY
ncbi:MAG: integrase core domain-containing protein [Gallionella sp.]|nr:integrase core domain-containing protein [Gallionella sp.]